MKVWDYKNIFSFIELKKTIRFLGLAIFLLRAERAFPQNVYVMVGDTLAYTQLLIPDPLNCGIENISYTHHEGADFFLKSDLPFPWAYAAFAPRKIGEQRDTFYITYSWTFRSQCYGPPTSPVGPFIADATGLSDSVILIRPTINGHADFHTWYGWNADSNKYINNSESYWKPTFELINNVEDSTTFEFKFLMDLSAHFTPLVVIADSQGALYHCEPKVRRRNGYIIPMANPEGFPTDTAFVGYLQVLTHNSSSRDTLYIKYQLNFTAKQIKSVAPAINKISEQVRIFSLANDNTINIHINFPQLQNATLELYDALGRQLPLQISQLQIPSGTSSQKLDVGNLSSGCYILRMKMKDQVISKSFVITR